MTNTNNMNKYCTIANLIGLSPTNDQVGFLNLNATTSSYRTVRQDQLL